MKTFIFILLLLFCTANMQAQWVRVESQTTAQLSGAYIFGDQRFAFGGSANIDEELGIILSSTQGTQWTKSLENNAGIKSLFFTSDQTGYGVTASKDTLLVTHDLGATWQKIYSAGANAGAYKFSTIFFTNDSTGYAPGFKTTDYGRNWILQKKELNFFPFVPRKILFTDDSTGYVAGFSYWGEIYKTTDYGATWQPQQTPYDMWEIYDMVFPTAKTGYATGLELLKGKYTSRIMKTNDSGQTWNNTNLESTNSRINIIYCTDSATCYAVGTNGLLLKTTDGGEHWIQQNSGVTVQLNSIACTDGNKCFAVGDSGTIIETTNGGGEPNSVFEITGNNEFPLYPNPANDKLFFKSSTTQLISMKILDIFGQEMLQAEMQNGVPYIDISALPQGAYLAQCISSGKTYTRQFTVIR